MCVNRLTTNDSYHEIVQQTRTIKGMDQNFLCFEKTSRKVHVTPLFQGNPAGSRRTQDTLLSWSLRSLIRRFSFLDIDCWKRVMQFIFAYRWQFICWACTVTRKSSNFSLSTCHGLPHDNVLHMDVAIVSQQYPLPLCVVPSDGIAAIARYQDCALFVTKTVFVCLPLHLHCLCMHPDPLKLERGVSIPGLDTHDRPPFVCIQVVQAHK